MDIKPSPRSQLKSGKYMKDYAKWEGFWQRVTVYLLRHRGFGISRICFMRMNDIAP